MTRVDAQILCPFSFCIYTTAELIYYKQHTKEMQLNSPLEKGAQGVVRKQNRHNPLNPPLLRGNQIRKIHCSIN